jgi:hypothetical protein
MSKDAYQSLKDHFESSQDVELPGPRGAQGLKYKGRMFAMFYKGDLTVKLAPERVQEVIRNGHGFAHDPGTGKPMKDRVLIPVSNQGSWIQFCEESLEYVQKG